MIAASLAHPPDVLVVAAAGALVWLLALPQIRRERAKRPGAHPTASEANDSLRER